MCINKEVLLSGIILCWVGKMTKAVLIEGHIVEKNSNKQERYSETIIKSQFEPQTSFMLNSGC